MKVRYPIAQSLDFFDNPYEIIEFSKGLKYSHPEHRNYPGLRSDCLSNVNRQFFEYVARKQLRLFYNWEDVEDTRFVANMYFQKVSSKDTISGEGWIHQDLEAELTTIIYLNPNFFEGGTNVWTPKKEWYSMFSNEELVEKDFFNERGIDPNHYMSVWKSRQDKFDKVSSHNSVFNSCLYFDGNYWHSANLNVPENEDRLTLITFFHRIDSPKKAPIIRTT